MKILVRAPNWIGDQILSYPFYFALRQHFPEAHIVSVCVPWVKDIQFNAQVDGVKVLEMEKGQNFKDRMSALERAASELKQQGPWDLGISLPNSLSAAWLLFRSGVKRRRGYKQEGRGILLNDGVSWKGSVEKQGHRAQSYLQLLPPEAMPDWSARTFWPSLPQNELDPPIPGVLPGFDALREWGGRQSDQKAGPGLTSGVKEKGFWVLAPGATADSRRWASSSFLSLARLIHHHFGLTGLIMGGVGEVRIAQELLQDRSVALKDATGRYSLIESFQILRSAKFVVCNESGFAHLSALAGTPTQIVCGAADPKRTQPLGPGKVQIALNPVDCWPCERNVCMQPEPRQLQCLKGISPERVFEELKLGFKISS